MNCSLPGSFVHGTLHARILEWAAICFSRGSSQPRDQTCVSCTTGRFFTTEPPGKAFRLREGGFVPLELAPRRIPTAATRGRHESLFQVLQWMLTLRGGPELYWLHRCWALLRCPLPSADPPTPSSVFRSQPLQVARLTWSVWGYPHAETPASEERGHHLGF